MDKPIWVKLAPLILIALFLLIYQVLNDLRPSSNELASSLVNLSFLYALLWWFQMDRTERGLQLPLDSGFLLAALWPILIPFYLVKTHGWKSLWWLAALFGLYIVIYMLGKGLSLAIKSIVL